MKYTNPILTKMTRLLSTAFAALLMMGGMTSCSEQDTQGAATAGDAYLNLTFSTSSPTLTRATSDDETAANPDTESDIHSIKAWVFLTGSGDDALPLSYKEETLSEAAQGEHTLSLKLLRKIGDKDIDNIDLYILVNSEGTNMGDAWKDKQSMKLVTRGELQDLTFSSPFGITEDGKPETESVPENGLPISRAITNISVAGHVAETEAEAAKNPVVVPLVRAVSKLHFYFARKAKANTDNVKITKIEIDSNTLPVNGYAFPDEEEYSTVDNNKDATCSKYTDGSQYVKTVLSLAGVGTEGIREVEDPTTYDRDESEKAQDYVDRLNKDIGGHDLCYIRETNKAITGKIYFTLAEGGAEESETFTIPSEGNAIRNRELVVYGYFLEGTKTVDLKLKYYVADWNQKEATAITFD